MAVMSGNTANWGFTPGTTYTIRYKTSWATTGTISTATASMMTGGLITANVKLHKPRGWNGKGAVRCSGCARFAKVVGSLGNCWITECTRCGKDEGFIGKRF